MITVSENAKMLSAISKPYEMEGRAGTSHKVRLFMGGDIYSCNATPEQIERVKGSVGMDGTAVVEFSSPKENLRASFVSFEAE